MRHSFDIILTDHLLEVFSVSSQLCMEFYIVCDGIAFPCKGWTDCALSVISMWIEDVVRHGGNKKDTYILYFMDGPYWLEVQQEGEELILRGIEDRKEKEVQFTVSCTMQELRRKLKRTLYKLESIIQTNEGCAGWRERFQPVIDLYKEILRCQGDGSPDIPV